MAGNFVNSRVEKLIRNAGAHRVSADAVERMNELMTEWGTSISKYAVEIARHEGRLAIKENDNKLSSQK
jgi:histone H3/H4